MRHSISHTAVPLEDPTTPSVATDSESVAPEKVAFSETAAERSEPEQLNEVAVSSDAQCKQEKGPAPASLAPPEVAINASGEMDSGARKARKSRARATGKNPDQQRKEALDRAKNEELKLSSDH